MCRIFVGFLPFYLQNPTKILQKKFIHFEILVEYCRLSLMDLTCVQPLSCRIVFFNTRRFDKDYHMLCLLLPLKSDLSFLVRVILGQELIDWVHYWKKMGCPWRLESFQEVVVNLTGDIRVMIRSQIPDSVRYTDRQIQIGSQIPTRKTL